MFPNPVRGVIQAKHETWKGTPVFRQVRTAADHKAAGQGYANDYGNGRANVDPALAVAAGTVIRVTPTEGIVVVEKSGWRWGYAHMRQIRVAVGNVVTVGQQLGLVSDAHSATISNFSGPHLHFAIWQSIGGTWTPQDPWLLLAQNELPDTSTGDPDMKPVPRGVFGHIVNRKTTLSRGADLHRDPETASEVLETYPAGTEFQPVSSALVNGRTWRGGFLFDDDAVGYVFGWFDQGTLNPLVPIESGGDTSGAYNQGLADAKAAVDAVPER